MRNLSGPEIQNEIAESEDLHHYDCVRCLVHTEEEPKVLGTTKVKHDPNAVGKLTDITNIEFDYYSPAASTAQVDTFMNNVSRDLKLRGYDMMEILNKSHTERVERLQNHLHIASVVNECQSSLHINEDALAKQILNPGELPSFLCMQG